MAGPIAPEDPNVVVPPSVKRAAAKAAKAHKAAYPDQVPDPAPQADPQPQPTADPAPQPEPEPQPEPAPQVQPQPEPAPQATVGEEQWEHRYHSMEGRFRQSTATITQMQEQMGHLGDELLAAQNMIAQMRAGPPQPQPQVQPLLTDEDRKTYGPELIEVIQRAAREAVMPDVQKTQNEVRQVNQRVSQTATVGVYETLDEKVPNWREINTDPRFIQWCRLPDVYSGQVRGKLLKTAFQAANAPRVLAFFKGFLDEEQATGNAPAPQAEPQAAPRVAAVPLVSLAAPGRAHPAAGNSTPASSVDKPIFTRAQISAFYSDVRKGVYAGRDADKARDEAAIFAAQSDGRVR